MCSLGQHLRYISALKGVRVVPRVLQIYKQSSYFWAFGHEVVLLNQLLLYQFCTNIAFLKATNLSSAVATATRAARAIRASLNMVRRLGWGGWSATEGTEGTGGLEEKLFYIHSRLYLERCFHKCHSQNNLWKPLCWRLFVMKKVFLHLGLLEVVRGRKGTVAHWGSPFINSQGKKQGRSCWRLKHLSQTEEYHANLVFKVVFEGESLQL